MKALVVFLILLGVGIFLFLNRVMPALQPFLTDDQNSIIDLIEKSPLPAENNTSFPLTLPAGYSISIYAKNLAGARDIEELPNGSLLVSLTSGGSVVALIDNNNDGKSDQTLNVINNLDRPHGLALKCTDICDLFIAENNKVSVSKFDLKTYRISDTKKIIDLPSGGGHYTRSLLIKDNKLYISIGSSCNVCNESDERRAAILSSDLDGGNIKVFAKGLRNSVFMTLHPESGEIWATEMGRDLLGDNIPPDEINIIKEDTNYGWPVCYGKNVHDTQFDKNTYIRTPCSDPYETQSVIDLQAHSAPLGLAFLDKDHLLVAYHGSWNRSTPTGYKVVEFVKEGANYAQKDFITGWLKDGKALGRPVDILKAKNGKIYISDDKAGVIYVAYMLQ